MLWKIVMTESCVRWVDNNKFEISDLKAFQQKTLFRYFKTGTFQSFQNSQDKSRNAFSFEKHFESVDTFNPNW